MLLNAPADRVFARQALGPTSTATTEIRGAGGREGFVAGEQMAVVFPYLNGTGPRCGGKVAVLVPPAANPFYALLLAKEVLADHLETTYEAHHEVLLIGGTGIDMGKVKALGAERLRALPLDEVLAEAGLPADGAPLYHVVDTPPPEAGSGPPPDAEETEATGAEP